MFTSQNSMTSILIQSLAAQLSLFGLNPSQWELEPTTDPNRNIIQLRNRNDADFRMQARVAVKRDRLSISQLSVVSL